MGDIIRGGKELSKAFVTQATAQQAAAPEKPAEDQKDTKPQDPKETAKEGEKKADEVAKEDKKAAPSDEKKTDHSAEKSSEGDKEAGKEPKVELPGGPVVSDKKPEISGPVAGQPRQNFTQVEVDLLQSLSKRREEIENWSKQVDMKENLLSATEQRINDKIGQLKKLQKDLEVVLAQYNQQEDAKIRSLVKIYENMKPADAARIFDEMELPILLEVVDKMSERKAAPILANMTPLKAKELTVELAEQRKLQQPILDAISASQQDTGSANGSTPPAEPAGSSPAPAAAGR